LVLSRSFLSEAAKEIKALINASSAMVDGGVKLVREANAMQHPPRSSPTGLAAVNVAINMMEHSTAASAALAADASKPSELISQSRLEAEALAVTEPSRRVSSAEQG